MNVNSKLILASIYIICLGVLLVFVFNYLDFKDLTDYHTNIFATLSNFVALKGGALKREQYLSGDMADFLGNLFLGM